MEEHAPDPDREEIPGRRKAGIDAAKKAMEKEKEKSL